MPSFPSSHLLCKRTMWVKIMMLKVRRWRYLWRPVLGRFCRFCRCVCSSPTISHPPTEPGSSGRWDKGPVGFGSVFLLYLLAPPKNDFLSPSFSFQVSHLFSLALFASCILAYYLSASFHTLETPFDTPVCIRSMPPVCPLIWPLVSLFMRYHYCKQNFACFGRHWV